MVRKLSSNLSIEMPIFAAKAAVDVTVAAGRNAPPRRTLESLRIWVLPESPRFFRGPLWPARKCKRLRSASSTTKYQRQYFAVNLGATKWIPSPFAIDRETLDVFGVYP